MGRLLFLIFEDMADFEVVFALTLMRVEGNKKIVTISSEKRPVRSIAGLTYVPELTTSEAGRLADVDGLVLPGGNTVEQREELTRLIVNINEQNGLLAAICRGPVFLARAGVLFGRYYTTTYSEKATTDLGIKDPFDRSKYRDEDVVVDGNIITAKGDAFIDFGLEIADYFGLFNSEAKKEEVRNRMSCATSRIYR
jgi:4-methyl-5(b-hydroxyethyl)-thiazole monophosphate biosynthesis